MRICALSLWPAPTMVFFTRLGAYSATSMLGARRHQHGDAARLTELQRRGRVLVDEGRFDRRLAGMKLLDDANQTIVDRQQPNGERGLVFARDRAAADKRQPVAVNVDDAPAGAAEPRIDAQDANR